MSSRLNTLRQWQSISLTSMNLRYQAYDRLGSYRDIKTIDDKGLALKNLDKIESLYQDQMHAKIWDGNSVVNAAQKLPLIIVQLRDEALVGIIILERNNNCVSLNCCILESFEKLEYFGESILRLTQFVFENFDITEVIVKLGETRSDKEKFLKKNGFVAKKNRTFKEKYCFLDRKIWASKERPALLAVAAALVDSRGKILIAQRSDQGSMPGLWEFPGGKVLVGEGPESALIRELNEELDIDIAESCLAPFTFSSHIYEKFHLVIALYLCRIWRGNIKMKIHADLKWVSPSELRAFPTPAANAPLIAMLQDYL